MNEFRPFFIVVPPRTNYAGLANLLTVPGQCICYNEGERGSGKLEALKERMLARPEGRVGNASWAMSSYPNSLHVLFPQARYVLFEGVDKDFSNSLSDHYVLNIPANMDLSLPVCRKIWDFCSGELPWDQDRWDMLTTIHMQNITTDPNIRPVKDMGRVRKKPVSADIVPDCHEEYYSILREFLPEEAVKWVFQSCVVARFWDHVVDGDPISKAEVEISMNALIFEWPESYFYQAFGPQLRKAVAQSITEWRNGNAWDLCYRLPMAAAVACGNLQRYHELAPRLHETMKLIIKEDNSWER